MLVRNGFSSWVQRDAALTHPRWRFTTKFSNADLHLQSKKSWTKRAERDKAMLDMFSATKLWIFSAVVVCALSCWGQEVEVNPTKGGIALSVSAQQAYQLMPGESKQPVLSIECLHKGSKVSHLVMFQPGGMVAENTADLSANAATQIMPVTINGKKHTIPWAQYGDASTYAYAGKTDAERMEFIEMLLSSPTVSIEFKPFLTGTNTTAVFNVSKLHDEMNRHAECGVR